MEEDNGAEDEGSYELEDEIAVTLQVITWAEICGALQFYISQLPPNEKRVRKTMIGALSKIHETILDEPTPLDDLLL